MIVYPITQRELWGGRLLLIGIIAVFVAIALVERWR
jgi:hypothetical protein